MIVAVPLPDVVGVPLIKPLLVLIVRFSGRLMAEKVSGVAPFAVIEMLLKVPTIPFKALGVTMTGSLFTNVTCRLRLTAVASFQLLLPG